MRLLSFIGLIFVSVVLSLQTASPMPIEHMSDVTGGLWCQTRQVPGTCPNPFNPAGVPVAVGCGAVPVNLPKTTCLTTMTTIPIYSDCAVIPAPAPVAGFPTCGNQLIDTATPGGCWTHISCVPFM
jgi:hypothetical protein